MASSSDSSYKARLGEILRQRDAEALHLFLRQSAAAYGDERQIAEVEERSHEEMEELMHRMILSRPDLAELHPASRGWLAGRGLAEPEATPGRRSGSGPPRLGDRRSRTRRARGGREG